MQIKTLAFQSGHSAELQRRWSLPFGSLRLPRVPLGGFATSRSPLAAVAAPLVMAGLTCHLIASGAVVNINDSVAVLLNILPEYRLFALYPLLHTDTNGCSTIQDFDTPHFYSPLRGNMGSYVHV